MIDPKQLAARLVRRLPDCFALYPDGDTITVVCRPPLGPRVQQATRLEGGTVGAMLTTQLDPWLTNLVSVLHAEAEELAPGAGVESWQDLCVEAARRICPEALPPASAPRPELLGAIRASRNRAFALPGRSARLESLVREAGGPILIGHSPPLLAPLPADSRPGMPIASLAGRVKPLPGHWFQDDIDALLVQLPRRRDDDPTALGRLGSLLADGPLPGRFPHDPYRIVREPNGDWTVEHDVGAPFLMGVRLGRTPRPGGGRKWVEWNQRIATFISAPRRGVLSEVLHTRPRARQVDPQPSARVSKLTAHPFISASEDQHICVGPSYRDAVRIRGEMDAAEELLLALAVGADVIRYGWREVENHPYHHVGAILADPEHLERSAYITLDDREAEAWAAEHPRWERVAGR